MRHNHITSTLLDSGKFFDSDYYFWNDLTFFVDWLQWCLSTSVINAIILFNFSRANWAHLFLVGLVSQMQCGLVPVNGQVRRTELEFLGGTWQRAAPTEPVPWTPGAPATAALNNLQHEWVLVAQTVIAETRQVAIETQSHPLPASKASRQTGNITKPSTHPLAFSPF